LPSEKCRLVALRRKGRRIAKEILPLPYGQTSDQILLSDAFGLKETIHPEVGDPYARYLELQTNEVLSVIEKEELDSLKKELAGVSFSARRHELERQTILDLKAASEELDVKLKRLESLNSEKKIRKKIDALLRDADVEWGSKQSVKKLAAEMVERIISTY
jgi:hypothetical protein